METKLHHFLEVKDHDGRRYIPLQGMTYSIGRAPSNAIVIRSPEISRQHAILLRMAVPDNEHHLFRLVDGNLKGKQSTNGVFVNGEKCSSRILRHGDEIDFGGQTRTIYYCVSNPQELDVSGNPTIDYPSLKLDPQGTAIIEQSLPALSTDAELVRLASFLELSPHPIIEIDLEGELTYLNPAANFKFADIKHKRLDHPLLAGLADLVKTAQETSFLRDISLNGQVFQQAIYYLPESQLIRLFLLDITDLKRAEAAHIQAEKKYQSIFENATEGIFQSTPEGHYVIANPMLARIYGYDSPDHLINSLPNRAAGFYVEANRWSQLKLALHACGAVRGFESQAYRKDGSLVWISENVRAIYDGQEQILGYEGSVEDVTEKKYVEAELHRRDQLLQAIAQATNTLLIELDCQVAIQKALAILGNAAGVDCTFLCQHDSKTDELTLQRVWSAQPDTPVTSETLWQYQIWSEKNQGSWNLSLAQGKAIKETLSEDLPHIQTLKSILLVPLFVNQSYWGCLGIGDRQCQWSSQEESSLFTLAASVSATLNRHRIEQMMRHRALYDALTGLPNRTLFDEQLNLCLNNAARNDESLAVMFLDLDRFKTINDTLGHTLGDKLLQLAATRIAHALRAGDVVARWGGDEFTILLPRIRDQAEVKATAERILRVLDTVFEIEDHELYITGSIGIVCLDEHSYDAETLIRHADIALYRAKEQGRNDYAVYHPLQDSKSPELLCLEKDLRQALDRNEFVVYYQPRITLTSGKISEVEALIRWQHPQMGLVSPKVFIPLAEENGLILAIGEWVLRQACAQNKAWQEEGLPPVTVAVNLSPKQFRQPDLAEMIGNILTETSLEPHYLELEITESTAINDVEFTQQTLEKLRQMGIKLSIDDFGTGHSSLNRLQFLPLDNLKIDQSFIRELTPNGKMSHIVSTIVALGQNLGLNIVAEGVEEQEQLDFLKSIACDTVQGYLFHRPISAAEIQLLFQSLQP